MMLLLFSSLNKTFSPLLTSQNSNFSNKTMFSFLKKLLTFGKSEANDYLDKKEDPIKMSDLLVRDLKKELAESLRALAEVKTIAISAKREAELNKRGALEYEQKAIILLNKASTGEIPEADADRLAEQALAHKRKLDENATQQEANLKNYSELVEKLEHNVQTLKSQITNIEQEVRTLKARSRVGEATKRLNEQMSKLNSSGALHHIERMKQNVEELEIYNETQNLGTPSSTTHETSSLDAEINALLGMSSSSEKPSNALLQLKKEIKSRQNPEDDSFKPILP
ncbi:MAG: PspA/IM30 family protein [Cytophagales bacterium]|nr:MAG: PspA/IM30 family protein [Cytophagales bacterium]TAF62097.1 MAG: PspA/IM30 family protein [Cytophagales bacterium]